MATLLAAYGTDIEAANAMRSPPCKDTADERYIYFRANSYNFATFERSHELRYFAVFGGHSSRLAMALSTGNDLTGVVALPMFAAALLPQ